MPMVIEEVQTPESQDKKYVSDKITIKIWCGKLTR